MISLKSIDILELTKENGEIELFRVGDKVDINLMYPFAGSYKKENHIGIIKFIDTDNVEIDASKECESIIISPKYKDVESIKKHKK